MPKEKTIKRKIKTNEKKHIKLLLEQQQKHFQELLTQQKEDFQNLLEHNPTIQFEITDEAIIRLAFYSGNRLSVKDLIIKTPLTIEQATDCLENLAKKGFCEIKLEEIEKTGKIYYYFD